MKKQIAIFMLMFFILNINSKVYPLAPSTIFQEHRPSKYIINKRPFLEEDSVLDEDQRRFKYEDVQIPIGLQLSQGTDVDQDELEDCLEQLKQKGFCQSSLESTSQRKDGQLLETLTLLFDMSREDSLDPMEEAIINVLRSKEINLELYDTGLPILYEQQLYYTRADGRKLLMPAGLSLQNKSLVVSSYNETTRTIRLPLGLINIVRRLEVTDLGIASGNLLAGEARDIGRKLIKAILLTHVAKISETTKIEVKKDKYAESKLIFLSGLIPFFESEFESYHDTPFAERAFKPSAEFESKIKKPEKPKQEKFQSIEEFLRSKSSADNKIFERLGFRLDITEKEFLEAIDDLGLYSEYYVNHNLLHHNHETTLADPLGIMDIRYRDYYEAQERLGELYEAGLIKIEGTRQDYDRRTAKETLKYKKETQGTKELGFLFKLTSRFDSSSRIARLTKEFSETVEHCVDRSLSIELLHLREREMYELKLVCMEDLVREGYMTCPGRYIQYLNPRWDIVKISSLSKEELETLLIQAVKNSRPSEKNCEGTEVDAYIKLLKKFSIDVEMKYNPLADWDRYCAVRDDYNKKQQEIDSYSQRLKQYKKKFAQEYQAYKRKIQREKQIHDREVAEERKAYEREKVRRSQKESFIVRKESGRPLLDWARRLYHEWENKDNIGVFFDLEKLGYTKATLDYETQTSFLAWLKQTILQLSVSKIYLSEEEKQFLSELVSSLTYEGYEMLSYSETREELNRDGQFIDIFSFLAPDKIAKKMVTPTEFQEHKRVVSLIIDEQQTTEKRLNQREQALLQAFENKITLRESREKQRKVKEDFKKKQEEEIELLRNIIKELKPTYIGTKRRCKRYSRWTGRWIGNIAIALLSKTREEVSKDDKRHLIIVPNAKETRDFKGAKTTFLKKGKFRDLKKDKSVLFVSFSLFKNRREIYLIDIKNSDKKLAVFVDSAPSISEEEGYFRILTKEVKKGAEAEREIITEEYHVKLLEDQAQTAVYIIKEDDGELQILTLGEYTRVLAERRRSQGDVDTPPKKVEDDEPSELLGKLPSPVRRSSLIVEDSSSAGGLSGTLEDKVSPLFRSKGLGKDSDDSTDMDTVITEDSYTAADSPDDSTDIDTVTTGDYYTAADSSGDSIDIDTGYYTANDSSGSTESYVTAAGSVTNMPLGSEYDPRDDESLETRDRDIPKSPDSLVSDTSVSDTSAHSVRSVSSADSNDIADSISSVDVADIKMEELQKIIRTAISKVYRGILLRRSFKTSPFLKSVRVLERACLGRMTDEQANKIIQDLIDLKGKVITRVSIENKLHVIASATKQSQSESVVSLESVIPAKAGIHKNINFGLISTGTFELGTTKDPETGEKIKLFAHAGTARSKELKIKTIYLTPLLLEIVAGLGLLNTVLAHEIEHLKGEVPDKAEECAIAAEKRAYPELDGDLVGLLEVIGEIIDVLPTSVIESAAKQSQSKFVDKEMFVKDTDIIEIDSGTYKLKQQGLILALYSYFNEGITVTIESKDISAYIIEELFNKWKKILHGNLKITPAVEYTSDSEFNLEEALGGIDIIELSINLESKFQFLTQKLSHSA
jgi:hypothetical protein